MLRRRAAALLSAVSLAVAAACANQGMPPGGPPDNAPPRILAITPENASVIGKPRDVEIRFDEVISETPKGAQDLRELVFISPKSGQARVSWSRSRISIRPEKGWKPNTVYSIQIRAGIQDLRANGIDSIIRLVFSTGGPIPATRITGVAFDWAAGRGIPGSVVEAIAEDSTTYQAVADSVGRYELRHLPPGPYLLRAYADRNSNRELEPLEIWDSVRVTFTESAEAEFYAFQHDTVGLRITGVEVSDSNRVLKVTFDKPYRPEQQFLIDSVLVKRPDSSLVMVRLAQTAAQWAEADSARKKAVADSTRAANAANAPKVDSTPAMRARADSAMRARRADSIEAAAAAARRARQAAEREARARGVRYVPPDTTPPPKMNRPKVFTEMFIRLDTALAPQTQYRVEVRGVRSLGEVVRRPSRVFTTARRDTTTRRDTTARTDTTTRRDTTARRDTTTRRDTTARPAPVRPVPPDTTRK